MAVDLTRARAAYARAVFGDTAMRRRTGAASATVVGRFISHASETDRSGALRVPIGTYTFQCAVDADIALDDILSIGGQAFRVVFAPPVGALDVAKLVGLDGL